MEDTRVNAPELLAEACLLYHWTAENCLLMPALRFFAVLKAGRKMKGKMDAQHYSELCDIMAIPMCTGEYQKNLKSFYSDRASDRKPINKAMNLDDPATVHAISSAFAPAQGMFR